MKRNLLNLIIITTLAIAGCSKSKTPGPKDVTPIDNSLKFEIVSGNNQTGTTGDYLKDDIKVKVTKGGVSLSGYSLEYLGSGCNDEFKTAGTFDASGISTYLYRLAGNTGAQSLKATLINADGKRIDSISFSFTAVAPASGWHLAACTPFPAEVQRFCKLSTGRLFACFSGKGYLRYSDDEGVSWNIVTALGANHTINAVCSDAKDELVISAKGEGLFISKDAGVTWISKGNPFSFDSFSDMNLTADGKVMYATGSGGQAYLSAAGAAYPWQSLNINTSANAYSYPWQANNGDLYIVDDIYQLSKSIDGGIQWDVIARNIPPNPEAVVSFYIDSKTGWFYKGRIDASGGLFVSKDNGKTYTQLVATSNEYVLKPSVVNGTVYFDIFNQGLFKADGSGGKVKLFDDGATFGINYIVTDNDNIALSSGGSVHYFKK